MHPVPRRFRWGKTLRQFLPANPAQIVLLLAATCLSACFGRNWLVLPSGAILDAIGPLSRDELTRWVYLTQIFAFPLLLAGAGAYFCCLWRRDNVAKSWMRLAVAPGLIGIVGGLFVPALVVVNTRSRSILDKYERNPFRGIKFPTRMLTLNSGTGFQLAVLGLVLAILGWLMLRRGTVSLPLRFGPTVLQESLEEADSEFFRQKIFALYVLAFFGVGGGLLSIPLFNYSFGSSSEIWHSFALWFSPVQLLLYTLPLFLLAPWSLGEERRKRLLQVARLPPVLFLGLALLFPIVVYWSPHLLAYALDRIAWAQHWSAMSDAPLREWYFHVPPQGAYLVLYAIVAALSEWAWRGCIQPKFIRIFGISRGIFLVGILYGPVQFTLFPVLFRGLPGYFSHLVLQLMWGIVWSIVFGWLTLRAGSVWPAVICAALISVLAQAALANVHEIIPRQFVRLTLLASGSVLAFLLLRYFPLASQRRTPPLTGAPTISESTL